MADPPLPNVANPRVYLDVQVGQQPRGRMVIELYADVVPKTAENFRCLCTGEKGIGPRIQKPLHYKGTPVHRSMPQLFLIAGDIEFGTGAGGSHIWSRGGEAIASKDWPPVPTEAPQPAKPVASDDDAGSSGDDSFDAKAVGNAVVSPAPSRIEPSSGKSPAPQPLAAAEPSEGDAAEEAMELVRYFPDESFEGKAGRHTGFGCVSMANNGPDQNASQFCIGFGHTPWLNGKQVVIGTVRDGLDTLRAIEKVGSRSGVMAHPVTIVDCGMIK